MATSGRTKPTSIRLSTNASRRAPTEVLESEVRRRERRLTWNHVRERPYDAEVT